MIPAGTFTPPAAPPAADGGGARAAVLDESPGVGEGRRAAVVDRRVHLTEDGGLIGRERAERGIRVLADAGIALQGDGR